MGPATKEWFYPGDNIGEEFAYPKPQAMMPGGDGREHPQELSLSPEPAEQPHVMHLKQPTVQGRSRAEKR